MAEQMIVHEPGDRYITLNSEGRATVWIVQSDGQSKPERPVFTR